MSPKVNLTSSEKQNPLVNPIWNIQLLTLGILLKVYRDVHVYFIKNSVFYWTLLAICVSIPRSSINQCFSFIKLCSYKQNDFEKNCYGLVTTGGYSLFWKEIERQLHNYTPRNSFEIVLVSFVMQADDSWNFIHYIYTKLEWRILFDYNNLVPFILSLSRKIRHMKKTYIYLLV